MSNHRPLIPHPFLVASLAMATLVNCGHDETANTTAGSTADSTADSTASSNPEPPGPAEATPTAPAGTITVRVVDAPADVKELWVVVDGVSFKRCDGDSWSDKSVGGIAVDLIAVAAGTGNFAEILSAAELEPGNYCRLRLVLTPSGHHVVLSDESVAELKVPSGDTSGLKGLDAQFHIAPGIDTILTIDFDAEASLVHTGHKGRYILKPVLDLESVSYLAQDGQPTISGEFLGAESVEVGVDGGQFPLADGAVLTIPPGALLGPVVIAINRWHTETIGTISDLYQFLPHIAFEKPVQFAFPYDPTRATSDHLYVFDDHNMAPATFDPDTKRVVAEIQHFSMKAARSGQPGTLLQPGKLEDRTLPDNACDMPALQGAASACEGGALDNEGALAASIECSDAVRPFMPSCTRIAYRDLNDADDPEDRIGVLSAEFVLTEEEIARVNRAETTVEWQLRFFRQENYDGAPSAVDGLVGIETNLQGTVIDSPCADSDDEIRRSFAAVTLCPGDLVAGLPYHIDYAFNRSKFFGDPDYEFANSFVFEIIPGRICDRYDPELNPWPANSDNVWDSCSNFFYDDISDKTLARREQEDPLALMDSNFSWNCVDSTAQVVDRCLGDPNGESEHNVTSKDMLPLVVLANDERYYNRFDTPNQTCGPDPRLVSSHHQCTPVITGVECDSTVRGAATACSIKGGPFIHRLHAEFSPGVSNSEALRVFVGGLHIGDPIAWKGENEIAFPGVWDCAATDPVTVAYRHAGQGNPQGDFPWSKVSVKEEFDLSGACVTPDVPGFCQGKLNGWWCAPDDTARLRCAGGTVAEADPCGGDCVSMPLNSHDVCIDEYCKGRTDGIHCQGTEDKLLICDGGLLHSYGAPCPQGTSCEDLQGPVDACH